MFEGFERRRVDADGIGLSVRLGGSGPPVLLLHGFPQTGAAWHLVAPKLAEKFTVIVPDLPGYGDSEGPDPDDPAAYAKRNIATIMVTLMRELGHPRFRLAGHDRGGRVAYRLAFDHPDRVEKLALLDIATTLGTWDGMDWKDALANYHWPFLAQPHPLPERLIGADPVFYLHHLLDRWAGSPGVLDPAAVAEYETAIRNPAVVQAMCNDYRAGATIDREIDLKDRNEGKQLSCPLLLLRGSRYIASPLADAWRAWTSDATEVALDCGHFIAEEKPDDTAGALGRFFLDAAGL